MDIKTTGSPSGEPDIPLFFSDWLKQRRKQLDLTQNELADRANCSVFALRKIEAGERRPSKQLAGLLAKSLEITTAEQPTFIKIARGELSVEKLLSIARDSPGASKPGLIPGNMPRALTPFIGREPELTAIAQLLHDPQCSLLTIAGAGGIGKTRLAIEAAHQSKDRFPDGIWFIPLVSLNSPELIVPAIADALGFIFQDPTMPQAQLLRYLRTKKALLVLDNAEHLLEGAQLFTEILRDCQHIKLLVTSRERLNLLSEWVFELQGFPLPPNDQMNQFEAYSSVELFVERARRVKASFAIRDEERQWVLKICQIMQGMPLGIELSAAWVGLLSIEEIAKEIEHNLDFLSVSMRDLPDRHRSLRATLDHSWTLLNSEEKLILSRLAVFKGSFSRSAAQEICGASLALLSSLKNKSLLQRTEGDEYSLHEIIHQYAMLKLAEYPDENERVKDKHSLYYVQYLARCEKALQNSRQVETFDEMTKVIDNLSQGWQHITTHCKPGLGISKPFPAELLHSALFSLSLFYEERCRSMEAIPLFKESVGYMKTVQAEYCETDDGSAFITVLGHIMAYLGLHHYYIHAYEQSIEYLDEALEWLVKSHASVEIAQANVMLAAIINEFGRLQESLALNLENREVFRQEGEEWWYTLSTIHIASTYLALGNLRESVEFYQEGVRVVKPGDLRLELPLRSGMAKAIYLQGDYNKAVQLLQDNLELSYRLGSDRQTAYIFSSLGRVTLSAQRTEVAEDYFRKSIDLLREFGESHELAIEYMYLGICLAARSDYKAAGEQFWKVIRIGREIDKLDLVHYGLVYIAQMNLTEGQTEKALEIYLMLRNCRIEYKRVKDDFNHLYEALHEALPGVQLETDMVQADSKNPPDKIRDDLLKYVEGHKPCVNP